jgi:hypothetical protein
MDRRKLPVMSLGERRFVSRIAALQSREQRRRLTWPRVGG